MSQKPNKTVTRFGNHLHCFTPLKKRLNSQYFTAATRHKNATVLVTSLVECLYSQNIPTAGLLHGMGTVP